MKILAVYPGRFQPFHKGHAQVYQWLNQRFDEAVIATSNKVEAPKSPFNFNEKKRMMVLSGVPSSDIVQVTNPYIAKEVLKNYDPKKTVLLFAVSQKDMDEDPRFNFAPTKSGKPGYLQPYKGNEKKLQPFGDRDAPRGYVVVTPTFTFNVLGKPATSASELRKQFMSLDWDRQKDFIKDLFGKYSEPVHKLMEKKIGDMIGRPQKKSLAKLKESFKEVVIQEEIQLSVFDAMLKTFLAFACRELGIENVPKIRPKLEDDTNTSFAAYIPSKNEMYVQTKNRHPMDIYRSVAHELVHHKQNEDGRLDMPGVGDTGSEIENEANAMAGVVMRNFGKIYPENFELSYVAEDTGRPFADIRDQLNEGINDTGKLKAIFLAGGPGSGKDFVMKKTLIGNGLRELNPDNALKHLMIKNKLSLMMPDNERVEREIVRGRAKNMTGKMEVNSLAGRLGLIINGTADDIDKMKRVKGELEDLGYDTMMVFVNTENEVSRQRNIERGQMGDRKVPDGTDNDGKPNNTQDIRQEKWEQAQKNIIELKKLFGQENFTVIDNTADLRKVTPEQKAKLEAEFNRVRKMAMKFTQEPVKNKRGQEWIERRARYQKVDYKAPKAASMPAKDKPKEEPPKSHIKPSSSLMDQARRLGLSYYGFGRFGRKVNGENKTLYISQGDHLAKAVNEEAPCWDNYKKIGLKKKNGKKVPNCVPANESIDLNDKFDSYLANTHNRDIGTTKLKNLYASMTPGQETAMTEEKRKLKFVKKKMTQEDNNLPRSGLPDAGGLGPETTQYRPFTVTGMTTMSESIQKWASNPDTQKKFIQKYGESAPQKLSEAALKLEQSGCGSKSAGKKYLSSFKVGIK